MNLKAIALATIATLTPAAAIANPLQQSVAANPKEFMGECVAGFYQGMKQGDRSALVTMRRAGVPVAQVAQDSCAVAMVSLISGDTMTDAMDLMMEHMELMVKPYFSHSYDRTSTGLRLGNPWNGVIW